jgi:hypothetical protein
MLSVGRPPGGQVRPYGIFNAFVNGTCGEPDFGAIMRPGKGSAHRNVLGWLCSVCRAGLTKSRFVVIVYGLHCLFNLLYAALIHPCNPVCLNCGQGVLLS